MYSEVDIETQGTFNLNIIYIMRSVYIYACDTSCMKCILIYVPSSYQEYLDIYIAWMYVFGNEPVYI